jgi:hypothetical protein
MKENITTLSKLWFLKRYFCLSDVTVSQRKNVPAFRTIYFYDVKNRIVGRRL